jgi:hypothetical protein
MIGASSEDIRLRGLLVAGKSFETVNALEAPLAHELGSFVH